MNKMLLTGREAEEGSRIRAEWMMENTDAVQRRGSREAESEVRDRVRDQSDIKQYNIQTVLAVLKRHQPISRTDIARLTGMSPTSVTRIVTALLNQGLIYETSGEKRAGRGRKATHLRLSENGMYSIGIHLDRSVIRLCLMNLADEVLYRAEALVGGEGLPGQVALEAKKLLDRIPGDMLPEDAEIGSVGVCLSGAVDKWRGVVSRSFRMNWKDVDLQAVFGEVFGMPACIENDVKACLVGEKVRMGIPDEEDTVYMLVGNGVGLAATSGSALVRGVRNEAGEIAEAPVGKKPDGTEDYLFNHLVEDCLIARAKERDGSVRSMEDILRAREQGAGWAEALVCDFREHLESAVRTIDCIYNPGRIIIGGAITHRLYPEIAERTGMEILSLGADYEDSCMTGAAMIAMRSAIVGRIEQSIE